MEEIKESTDDENKQLRGEIKEINGFWYFVVLMLIQTVSSIFNLAFPFIELVPDLECMTKSGKWASCSKREICTANVDYRVDWNSEYTINNIMTELDLICESDFRIGFLGSIVFLGFLLSSFTIMPTPDIFGRKPVLIVTTILSTIAPLLILFVRSLTTVYVLLFIYGFTILVRGTTSYVYALEFVPTTSEKGYVTGKNKFFNGVSL